jgi:hypothetical protein
MSGARENRGIRPNKGCRLLLPSRADYLLCTYPSFRFTGESLERAWCRRLASEDSLIGPRPT